VAAAAGSQMLRPKGMRAQTPGLYTDRSTVALVSGDDRRENVFNALASIDDQIQPLLRARKSVLIKPNVVVAQTTLAVTNVDALNGILDYLRLKAQFKGPIVIAESSAEDTRAGFANYGYTQLGVSLVDLNQDGRYIIHNVVDENLHVQPVRLAARLFDPDAFIICSAMLKTHDRVVATLSIKNMAMGAPLHSGNIVNGWWEWHDKPKMHDTHRLANMNICQVAQRLKPFLGVAVIDGYDGMEGDGPSEGTPVPSRLAIASTDFLAADRVGIECMGIDPALVGYLNYAAQIGLGQYDLSKIDIRDGVSPASVKRTYKLHRYIQDELQWLQPFPACNATGSLSPLPGRGL
jgi:uncharacterized protein (DUF362 family)